MREWFERFVYWCRLRGHNALYIVLAAGFCERWPATHEREGFSGWPPCQRVAAQRKKLAANEQEYNQCRLLTTNSNYGTRTKK